MITPDIYTDIFLLLIAAACGFLIGLERTREAKKQGARDHILIAMIGSFSMILYQNLESPLGLIVFITISLSMGMFILLTSVFRMFKQSYAGYTTTLALISAFVMGIVTVYSYELALTISTFILILLASKKQFSKIQGLSGIEWTSTIEFVAIVIIIIILIPSDILISGVSVKSILFVFLSILAIKYFSYFLLQGNKQSSIYIVSLLGGLAHSEATTIELAEMRAPASTVGLVIQTMLLRIIFVVFIAEELMRIVLWPLILTAIIGIYIGHLSLKNNNSKYEFHRIQNPISFKSAAAFSLTYLVAVVINVVLNLFTIPNWLYYIVSFLIGILSGGSASLFTATAYVGGAITLVDAVNMFLLGLSACIFNKVGYVWKFNKTKTRKYMVKLIFFLTSTVVLLAIFTYTSLYLKI